MNETLRKFIVTDSSDIPSSECNSASCVHLIYKINEKGVLQRAPIYSSSKRSLMGIYDYGGLSLCNTDVLIRDIMVEINRRNYLGVLLDFADDPSIYDVIQRIDYSLSQRHILHFLPVSMAQLSKDAKLIIPSSISGGSFIEMIEFYAEKYPPSRLCMEIVRSRNRFKMPSYKPEGEFLSNDDFAKLTAQFSPSMFFSSDLACKYFTYRDNDETFFVLYDDAETAVHKIRIAEKYNFFATFLLYSEWGEYTKAIVSAK